MERDDRNRYYQGGYSNENRSGDNRENRYSRDLNQEFEREHQSSHQNIVNDSGNFYRDSAYERDHDNSRFQNYRSHDYDMERNYYENPRGNQDNLGDIRQGYGISSFGGTSDRYNTANDMQRERNAQFEQGYGSGRMSGYSGSRFGGSNYSATGNFGGSSDYGSMSGSGGNIDDYVSSSGYGGGNSSVHSDRGIPNYSSRNFSDDYSASPATHYGGGAGYTGGNSGVSFGNSTYGVSTGNYGGYGSMGGSMQGSGNSGFGDNANFDHYAANADRGGYINRDPNRDSGY